VFSQDDIFSGAGSQSGLADVVQSKLLSLRLLDVGCGIGVAVANSNE